MATYFASLDCSVHSSAVLLRFEERRLVLLDLEGITVDVELLRQDEEIIVGTTVDFPCHTSRIGTDRKSVV